METQKVINVLNYKDEDDPKFQTKKWYIINDQNNGRYDKGNENDSTIKFNTQTVKSLLVDYSDAYILFTGDIKVVGDDDNTRVAFKNCHSFIRAVIHVNDEHVNTIDNLDLRMNLYNLIEYSDNYSDTTGSLYHYKRSEQPRTGNNINNLSTAEGDYFSYSFKHHHI